MEQWSSDTRIGYDHIKTTKSTVETLGLYVSMYECTLLYVIYLHILWYNIILSQ